MSETERESGTRAASGTPDARVPEVAALPARPASGLTNDLASDTGDLATLKQRLDRARERLSFYESFDRIIQENIRRSSELMIEATALHERAERATAAQAESEANLARQRAADRAHYAALLGDLQSELDRTRTALDGFTDRLTNALKGLAVDTSPNAPTAPAAAPASSVKSATVEGVAIETAPPVPRTVAAPAKADVTAPIDAAHEERTIEVLVHGVPTARVAISFQNHLRGLDRVSEVEAREFVEGLLRLQVRAAGGLDATDLAGWDEGDGAETLRALPDLLEISLPGTTER